MSLEILVDCYSSGMAAIVFRSFVLYSLVVISCILTL